MHERSAEPRLGAWVETTLRVRYAETDAMGIAHHSEYLAWYEVGRTEWIRQGGLEGATASYRQLEAAGFMLPVIEVSSRHVAPARYDDVLTVRSRLAEATRARLLFEYEVRRDGALLASGRTEHAVTGASGRPRRMPPELLAWLAGPPAVPPAILGHADSIK